MNVQLTKDEIEVLVSYCDLACRSQGLQAAGNALHLVKKLREAQEDEPADELEES